LHLDVDAVEDPEFLQVLRGSVRWVECG